VKCTERAVEIKLLKSESGWIKNLKHVTTRIHPFQSFGDTHLRDCRMRKVCNDKKLNQAYVPSSIFV